MPPQWVLLFFDKSFGNMLLLRLEFSVAPSFPFLPETFWGDKHNWKMFFAISFIPKSVLSHESNTLPRWFFPRSLVFFTFRISVSVRFPVFAIEFFSLENVWMADFLCSVLPPRAFVRGAVSFRNVPIKLQTGEMDENSHRTIFYFDQQFFNQAKGLTSIPKLWSCSLWQFDKQLWEV